MADGAAMRPLADSLELVASEVGDLARMADRLQALILRLAGSAVDPLVMIEAQAVDLLAQRLDGLAGYVRALAQAAPQDLSADVAAALRSLTLAEQARRLSGAAPAAGPAPELTTFWD